MAGITIPLPAQLNGITLSRVAAAIVAAPQKGLPSEIIFDFAGLQFVRPTGVVFLSNLIWWLRENRVNVVFKNMKQQSAALFYLDDFLFFEQHTGSKLRSNATTLPTTRPLIRIANQDSHAWLDTNLLPWLSARLSITEASLYEIKSCVSESLTISKIIHATISGAYLFNTFRAKTVLKFRYPILDLVYRKTCGSNCLS